jgi:sortase A
MRRAAYALALALALVGLAQLASAGWIHAKARLAQRLIASAWVQARAGAPAAHPWPGADLAPIARLTVPARGVDLYVLDNAAARTLAFGPGLVAGTPAPGGAGNAVIVAHRDTHFAFLRELQRGDEIDIEGTHGARTRYRVSAASVVDKGETEVLDAGRGAELTLITCFPFDAVLPGTRLRYVVVARRVA